MMTNVEWTSPFIIKPTMSDLQIQISCLSVGWTDGKSNVFNRIVFVIEGTVLLVLKSTWNTHSLLRWCSAATYILLFPICINYVAITRCYTIPLQLYIFFHNNKILCCLNIISLVKITYFLVIKRCCHYIFLFVIIFICYFVVTRYYYKIYCLNFITSHYYKKIYCFNDKYIVLTT